jgi:hypothetical protein
LATSSETPSWPATSEQLGRILWSTIRDGLSETHDTAASEDHLVAMAEALQGFLNDHYRGGFIVVKTSTAGNRTLAHEVSTPLLEHVLTTTLGGLSSSDIVLADGPAFGPTYRAECNRLGWDDITRRLGVRICDLNVGLHHEIASEWPISSTYLEADLIINLTKAKTHRRFGVSLAEKSLLGVLSGDRLGYPKLERKHRYVPWLVERIKSVSPPIFSIIDGQGGMEGEGPLRATPTRSHFVSFGPGCLGPDLRATVEMGFDPTLVPLFCRPFNKVGAMSTPHWTKLRMTTVDFLPAKSCSWLYQSLAYARRRSRTYSILLEGARQCWPQTT